jgi:predicted nucleotidyltransferase
MAGGIIVDEEALAAFCGASGVRRFGLFGSAVRGELCSDSDIDFLESSAGQAPGLLRLGRMELSWMLVGRRVVDLRPPADLSRHI